MNAKKPTYEELEARLAEAEAIIAALRREEVDAVGGDQHAALLRLQEAEKALQESEAKHRLILESISEVVYMLKTTPDNPLAKTVEFVSRQAESIVGYAPEEFMRDPDLWASLIHPDDRQAVEQATRQIYASRSSGTRDYRMRHKRTGEYRWMEDRVVPQLDGQGILIPMQESGSGTNGYLKTNESSQDGADHRLGMTLERVRGGTGVERAEPKEFSLIVLDQQP
ncbi:MAG: PAS domain-containing protein, partial [Chloroflexota bacterium]